MSQCVGVAIITNKSGAQIVHPSTRAYYYYHTLTTTQPLYNYNITQEAPARMLRRFCALARFSEKGEKANFGFQEIPLSQKQHKVDEVFHSVAAQYDRMNDAMSLGVHRCWKDYFVNRLGILTRKGEGAQRRVLDVAGGTGDIAFKILQKHKRHKDLKVTVLDINESMLQYGKQRAEKLGYTSDDIEFVCANAEQLPFEPNTFDAYTIAFGLRNVPRTSKALAEAHRVLKRGGKFSCLQFSKVTWWPFSEVYRFYSFNIIPMMGQFIANDRKSYQYLVQSIQKFYDQETLLQMIQDQGFKYANYENLTQGIVAIHNGYKFQQ